MAVVSPCSHSRDSCGGPKVRVRLMDFLAQLSSASVRRDNCCFILFLSLAYGLNGLHHYRQSYHGPGCTGSVLFGDLDSRDEMALTPLIVVIIFF